MARAVRGWTGVEGRESLASGPIEHPDLAATALVHEPRFRKTRRHERVVGRAPVAEHVPRVISQERVVLDQISRVVLAIESDENDLSLPVEVEGVAAVVEDDDEGHGAAEEARREKPARPVARRGREFQSRDAHGRAR